MKRAIIAIGIPGSGKTSVLKPFAQKHGFAYISRDDIREELFGNAILQENKAVVWAEADRRTIQALQEGKSVILDSTFAERGKRAPVIQMVRQAGAQEVVGMFFDVPLARAKQQNKERTYVVKEEVIEMMHQQLITEPPHVSEGFDAVYTVLPPMNSKTVVFFGIPGCGKGTQFEILRDELKKQASAPVLPFQWSSVRDAFMQKDSALAREVQALTAAGERLPTFIAPSIWLPGLTETYADGTHLLIDGVPRHPVEAELLDSFFASHQKEEVHVIHIDVSAETAIERMRSRALKENRTDDQTMVSIQKRLTWYETDTKPLLTFFEKNPRYLLHTIDGSLPPEEVFAEIRKKVLG